MSKIKIETLSPVHIGSGNLLQNNTDFVVDGTGDDSYIHIVDERKILELIGSEHIDHWLLSIENKDSTKALVKRFSPSSSVDNYSLQSITNYAGNIKQDEMLKEVIHSGLGLPYIPGSSIKGAIRTVVLASLAEKITDRENKILVRNKNGEVQVDNRGNKSVSAKKIEKELFGNDPYSDIFRFLRVGDAYFEKDSLIATRMINLNITTKDILWDTSKPQLIEAINIQEKSTFELQIAKQYYDWVKPKFDSLGFLPEELSSIDSLFMLINGHTLQLLEDEIEYWKELNGVKSDAEDYIEVLEDILGTTKSCVNDKSCVLRIGHGSGWKFITGAWAEELENFNSDVTNAARPNNHKYQSYDFPKSRRIDDNSDVLGFVKLTEL